MTTPPETIAVASSADPYWPGDSISLAVWSAIGGRADLQVDDEPEDVIDRLRRHGYSFEQACEELGISATAHRELHIAAAWAGIARVATARRDAAVRWCHEQGAPKREIGRAIGAAGNGVTAVDRILDR